jgi:hypothetical protein
MTELVSGMPAPQFGDESSRVRGSELVQGSSGSRVRCFHVPHNTWGYANKEGLNTTNIVPEILSAVFLDQRFLQDY